MKLIKNHWLMTLVTIFFWCILNESFRFTTILIGLPISVFTNVVIYLLFTDTDNAGKNDSLNFLQLLKYVIVLFFNIFKSAKTVLGIILYSDDTPMIVTIKTKALKEWPRCLIANAITLTPGTVTIDLTDDLLTVLWLNPTTDDPTEAARIILGHFEKALLTKEELNA